MAKPPNKTTARELERIRKANSGSLSAENVVDAARKKSSPLHDFFEWNDGAAAELYRLEQARHLIRVCVTIIPTPGGNKTVRTYVSLRNDRGESGYRATVDVLSDADLREQMLREAMVELQGFQRKYGTLSELAPVFAAMKRVRQPQQKRAV